MLKTVASPANIETNDLTRMVENASHVVRSVLDLPMSALPEKSRVPKSKPISETDTDPDDGMFVRVVLDWVLSNTSTETACDAVLSTYPQPAVTTAASPRLPECMVLAFMHDSLCHIHDDDVLSPTRALPVKSLLLPRLKATIVTLTDPDSAMFARSTLDTYGSSASTDTGVRYVATLAASAAADTHARAKNAP